MSQPAYPQQQHQQRNGNFVAQNPSQLRPKTAGLTAPKPSTEPAIIVAPPRLTPLEDIPTPTMQDLEFEYADAQNLETMCQAHNDLIKVIIDKEEDLISSHRVHID